MSFAKKFQTEYERLNPQQREAVETIEWPLLIVAGPGTGKTQTLALRLANILKKTQAKPHNLLALTFTEAAAINLKKRLAGIIGSEAYGITATTFHAFCSRIHSTFPSEFASTRERIPIDELRQSQLFREILAKGGAERFELLAPLRAPDLYLRDLSRAVSDLKREGISPERLREILAGEKGELSQEERINPRTQKPLGRILTREKQLAKNFELATFYENYQKQLEEKGFTDFDDLILSVVEKLNSEEEFLLAYLQENFLYTTVDEFQDTNGAQNAILRAWGSFPPDGGQAANPNLCVVGDDDQSIFRFQGASLENILDFHKNYPEAKIVTLTQNYRSTPEVIAAAESLIERNAERLVNKLAGLEKILQAVAKSEGRKPQIVEAGSEADEASFIVTEIENLIKSKIPLEEIAVIYRNRKHADVLAGALGRKQLPFFRADGQNALLNSRVQQLLKLLRVVENPQDALSSLAVFFADFSEIPEVEVYRLAKEASERAGFLDVGLESGNEPVKAFAEKLLSFQKAKAEQNLLELVENVAAESGLTREIAGHKEYESAEAVHAFLAFVRNFAITRGLPADRQEDASLQNLLEDLRAMEQQGIKLPIPSRAHAAITLTTAHSAKGLEWENVFLIHADDNSWGGRAKRQMIKLQGIGDRVQGIDEKEKKIEDERRLFFVALTRAKRQLTISFAREYDFRASVESRFIAEIEPNLVSRIEAPKADFAILPMAGEQKFTPATEKFLHSLLENFKLSPTALNNYLSCPQKFLFQNLLRIPTKTEVADRLGMIFGNAMHAAFEEFFREFKNTEQVPDIAVAVAALKKNLDREPLTAAQRQNVERDAISALGKYLAFHAASFTPPIDVEYNFGKHDVHLDEVALTGKVDRIDLIRETKADVSFVDYKSMKPFSRAAIRGETANSTGDSYRQLLFYMLLAELDSRFIFQPKETVLSFVRENEKGEFINESFKPKKEEVEELKKTIKEVWVKMQKLEFGCEEGECRKCNFGGICGKGDNF
ncbi:ATP-dependent helicase [Candidatus Gracilibacteria bacterium]|nr:ATP-dependent helicase [Candidatus Gracilibacteria bacterium]MCF7856536.1 ATP-dependent helicase [Candidatus Gracilibacteria bacterium]